MRKNETEEIKERYKQLNLNVHYVDASKEFLKALAGVEEPEQKDVSSAICLSNHLLAKPKNLVGVSYLAQGTIYPDVIESALSMEI